MQLNRFDNVPDIKTITTIPDDDLATMLRTLMTRFVKKSLVESATTVSQPMKIAVLSTEVHCNYKDADIGVAARSLLIKTKASERQHMQF